MVNTLSDEKLIAEFVSEGSIEAFEALLERYQNQVFRMVLALTGNVEDAQDVSQEIFVKLFSRLKSFQGRSAFSTWLYTVVQNTVKNYRIKKSLRYMLSLDTLLDEEHVEFADPSPGFESRFEMQEALSFVNQSLKRLPFKLRQALVLRESSELSYEEMAGVMRCSIGTVKSRLSRAREKLKEVVQIEMKGGEENGTESKNLPKREVASRV